MLTLAALWLHHTLLLRVIEGGVEKGYLFGIIGINTDYDEGELNVLDWRDIEHMLYRWWNDEDFDPERRECLTREVALKKAESHRKERQKDDEKFHGADLLPYSNKIRTVDVYIDEQRVVITS